MKHFDLLEAIKERYPFHVARDLIDQPDPRKLTAGGWPHFGRVPHEIRKSNLWCFETEETRERFITEFGGEKA